MAVDEWPEPDRAAWQAAHRRGGLLDDDGLAASWATATSAIIAGGYGRFLSYLAGTGALDPTAALAERISRARVEDYVAHLRERNYSSTVAGRILQLSRAAAVMAPQTDWQWLRRISARLKRMAVPARDDRLRLPSADHVRDIVGELLDRAEAENALPALKRALAFRDGLLIAIGGLCALRARNLAEMRLGSNLQRRGDEWWVTFTAEEMKNKRPYEAPLPGITNAIDRYIAEYRPVLLSRSNGPRPMQAVWISDNGRPLSAKGVGQVVSRRTGRDFGRSVNPHLLRKLVPTELAIRDPAHVGIAQPLLGHAEYRTTERAYNLGRALDAAARHQRLLQNLRDG